PMRAGRAFSFLFAFVALVVVGLAGLWTYVAQQFVATSIVADHRGELDRGRAVFELAREQTQEGLRAQCRVLVEDPRLKSTLSTEGIDEATVADILGDLAKLRRTGMLVVLSPDGHVFAEANADELKGLDLSASSVFKKLQGTADAVVGSWVIGGKIIDLSATAIRFNSNVIAYLVVGQAVDQDLVKQVAEAAGVDLAIVLGNAVALAAPDDSPTKTLLASIAHDASGAILQVHSTTGERYLGTSVELEDSAQARPRLVIARGIAPTFEKFETLRWLLWLVPPLVVLALLLSVMRSRSGGTE
ncbi:MAG: hypothetical protein ACM31C_06105, partial [Acidobacteriota bacterium]